jgi:hypothetical protein
VTVLGLAVSVLANIGHVGGASWTTHVTASVPPLAAALSLAVALGTLKRVVAVSPAAHAAEPVHSSDQPAAMPGRTRPTGVPARNPGGTRKRARKTTSAPQRAERVFADVLAAGELPSIRSIKSTMHVGTPKAREIRQHLLSVAEIQSPGPGGIPASSS